jgi:hypothetical protein
MFFHAPTPASLTYLLAPDMDNGKLWKLDMLGADKADNARGQLGAPLIKALDTPNQTMKDFIAALGA